MIPLPFKTSQGIRVTTEGGGTFQIVPYTDHWFGASREHRGIDRLTQALMKERLE